MKSSHFPVSVYIHWPYCLSKCPYCDFASVACHSADEAALGTGYRRDIRALLPPGRPIQSVFFGGGTPSLMSPRLLSDLLAAIFRDNPQTAACEITLEANPDAIDLSKMRSFQAAGVNRLSLGVQALDEAALRFLGRRHTLRTALERVAQGMTVFGNVNMDLIYARPGQTVEDWRQELERALSFGLPHYSLYQLTIEEGTPFGRRGVGAADEKTGADLYCVTDEIMAAAGVPAYEVSNYARSGFESRHNLTYWTGGDYVGIGPAAHGRIGLTATRNPTSVRDWLERGTETETLTPVERQTEKLLMGLRLRRAFYPVTGLSPQGVQQALAQGWIEQSEAGIRPTRAGTLMLNQLILLLMPG